MAYNVLIVDDSPAMRAFIQRLLELSGLEMGKCLQAGNGREALDTMGQEWIDVVLTDINMPVMDGEQFVRAMHGDNAFPAIPVIVVSTDKTESRKSTMFKLGAKGYVTKPFTPQELRDEVEGVLGVANER